MMTHVMVGGSWCSDIYFFKIFPVAHRHQKIQIKATEHAVWTHGFTRAIVQRFQMGCVCLELWNMLPATTSTENKRCVLTRLT